MATDRYTRIVCAADPALTVFVDRVNKASQVWAEYDRRDGDAPAQISTPFQAADMPMDDQAAAAKVSDWLDCQQG